ncbi:rhodanese-like domain-containing protein [Flindersiella endophytica]
MSTQITRDELRAAIDNGTVTVIDALPAAPYSARHLPGALNLTSEEADAKAADLLPDKSATIVTYSTDSACTRGPDLAGLLERLGYTDVRLYSEGIADWVQAGLPVESA